MTLRPLPDAPTRRATSDVRMLRVGGDASVAVPRPDRVATEEPLQILAGGPGQESGPVAVTMRTPGHDFELAVGFLWGEGILTSPDHVRQVKYCEVPADQPQRYNVVTVRASFPVAVGQRPFTTTASCGICGTATLDDIEKACAAADPAAGPFVSVADLVTMPDRLRAYQRVFSVTGGLHAAALLSPGDPAEAGAPLVLREDVGRHNAVDKVIGWAVLARRVPVVDAVLVVSGRVSFEIVQKAAMAGVAVIAAVSAPTSLAVDAAARLGITLAAFVRDGSANLYSHPSRILT